MRTKKWIEEHRCSHCSDPLPDVYRKKNCEKCIIKRNMWGWDRKLKALQRISSCVLPKCILCSITDIRILTINHINGVRKKHGKRDEGGYKFYRDIINGSRRIDDLEVRCFNCNILYEFEIGNKRVTLY